MLKFTVRKLQCRRRTGPRCQKIQVFWGVNTVETGIVCHVSKDCRAFVSGFSRLRIVVLVGCLTL